MNDYDTENKTREAAHGGDMETPMEDPGQNHCHTCWKYTDDLAYKRDVLARATEIVINGGTLDVKNSDAFKAADEFLAKIFSREKQLSLPGWK